MDIEKSEISLIQPYKKALAAWRKEQKKQFSVISEQKTK
jgi:hypothetical protein